MAFFLYILIISCLCFWHSRCLAILQQNKNSNNIKNSKKMKRLALVASFCGITITQMMAQNINGEQISDTTLFDKFSKELGEVVVKAHLPQYKKTHEGLLTFESRAI